VGAVGLLWVGFGFVFLSLNSSHTGKALDLESF